MRGTGNEAGGRTMARTKLMEAIEALDDDELEFLSAALGVPKFSLAGIRVAPADVPDARATKIALEAALRRMATEE